MKKCERKKCIKYIYIYQREEVDAKKQIKKEIKHTDVEKNIYIYKE